MVLPSPTSLTVLSGLSPPRSIQHPQTLLPAPHHLSLSLAKGVLLPAPPGKTPPIFMAQLPWTLPEVSTDAQTLLTPQHLFVPSQDSNLTLLCIKFG